MKSTEKETQRAILAWLKDNGIFAWRTNSGVDRSQGRFIRYGTPGAGDITAVIRGVHVEIEVKDIKKSAKQNENQVKHQKELEQAGGVYILARSLDDVIERLTNTRVQFCIGDGALPFQPKSYEEELRACKRYYERHNT